MAIPLPQFQSLGEMILERMGQGSRNALMNEELRSRNIENKFAPEKNRMQIDQSRSAEERRNQLFPEQLKQQKLFNIFNEKINPLKIEESVIRNRFLEPEIKSRLDSQSAQLNKINKLLPYEIQEAKLRPDLIRAQIENTKELAKNRSLGVSGLGTDAREELFYRNEVAKDNPQLKTENQIREAANVLAEGGNTLSDGIKLNPLSSSARKSLDRTIKGSTTSGALTPLIVSNQAEAEIEELSKFSQEGLKEYGDTYFNMSPQQILDTFKTDEKSQKKLGKFIAAQQIQYEIAQNEIKQAMGQPGVTSTQELLHSGQQLINAQYPRLSYTARKEANDYFIKALKSAQKARKEAGVSASKALEQKKDTSENNIMTYNPKTGRLE